MGPVGLKPQGGSSNAVGVGLKYLWVSVSHLLGPAREAPRFDALTLSYCPSLRLVSVRALQPSLDGGGVIHGGSVALNACEYVAVSQYEISALSR